MKREIEISAAMNAAGYYVKLKINGRAFSARRNPDGEQPNITTAIGEQLDCVYGPGFKTEYWKYKDIYAAVNAVAKIESSLHELHRRLKEGADDV